MGDRTSKYKVLIVDDDPIVREIFYTLMSENGHKCRACADGVEALEVLEGKGFDAVITDIKMPNMDGIELTREIRKIYVDIPVMVVTGYTDEYSTSDALGVGASEFIYKPVNTNELMLRFEKMMSNHQLLTSIKEKKKTLAHKSSKKLLSVYKQNEGERKALQDEIKQLKKQLEGED